MGKETEEQVIKPTHHKEKYIIKALGRFIRDIHGFNFSEDADVTKYLKLQRIPVANALLRQKMITCILVLEKRYKIRLFQAKSERHWAKDMFVTFLYCSMYSRRSEELVKKLLSLCDESSNNIRNLIFLHWCTGALMHASRDIIISGTKCTWWLDCYSKTLIDYALVEDVLAKVEPLLLELISVDKVSSRRTPIIPLCASLKAHIDKCRDEWKGKNLRSVDFGDFGHAKAVDWVNFIRGDLKNEMFDPLKLKDVIGMIRGDNLGTKNESDTGDIVTNNNHDNDNVENDVVNSHDANSLVHEPVDAKFPHTIAASDFNPTDAEFLFNGIERVFQQKWDGPFKEGTLTCWNKESWVRDTEEVADMDPNNQDKATGVFLLYHILPQLKPVVEGTEEKSDLDVRCDIISWMVSVAMKVVKTAKSHDELMNGALELMCEELSKRAFFDSAMKSVSGDLKKLTNERARTKGTTLDLPNGWKEKLERSNRSIGIQEQSLNGRKQKNVKKRKSYW